MLVFFSLPINKHGRNRMVNTNWVTHGNPQQERMISIRSVCTPTALYFLCFWWATRLFAAPVELVEQAPLRISTPTPEVHQVDFGRVAFGNLKLVPPAGAKGTITVHFGEKLQGARIDTSPPGAVRYHVATVELTGNTPLFVAPPADARNSQPSAGGPSPVLTPAAWGVVLPFRWVEIEAWPGELQPEHLSRRAAISQAWEDDAASFECSDPLLNQIWELCRYSIKATTFAGLYVDGDRERIPYEADAYLNQRSHYTTDNDIQFARDTFDWLMQQGTWPTEWAPHMIFMAHADYLHTGDKQWLVPRYEALKSKMLFDRAGPDGLIRSNLQHQRKLDIVDWPQGERDDYVFTEINTVVNAFHLASIKHMIALARALGKDDEATAFESRLHESHGQFQQCLFDSSRGIYRDGVGTEHASHHANLFPLAFGLVPQEERPQVVAWLKQRDMDCSVYAAQYLLEGLFRYGGEEKAFSLMTADTDRSWRHMVDSGTTITWEAWDQKYKPNQDWNHAWGAAPANLLPRFVLGVEPLEPGWKRASIRPCPGNLEHASGKVPTPLGPVGIAWKYGPGFRISFTLPQGMLAKVDLPAAAGTQGVYLNGKQVSATRQGDRWILTNDIPASATIEVK